MQTIRGRRFVDGGVADNTPIFPTLAHAPRAIVIIYLTHTVTCGSVLREQEAKRVADVSERLRCAQLSTLEQTIEKTRKVHVAEAICRSGIPEQEAAAKFVDLWSGRRHWWFPTIFQENSRATINPRVHFLSQAELSALSEREQKKENKWMNDVLQAIDRTRLSPVEKRERRNELLSGEKNWWYPAIFPTLFGPHGPPDENWSCDSEVDRFEQARLLAIIPSEPIELLPSLGTLNFFARKAQRLIRLGYRDSLRAVCDEAHGRALV
jgi:hypothetical protein